ncbi:MAG: hypothetical protein ABIA04_10790 [Pseudomonadota bacterium]
MDLDDFYFPVFDLNDNTSKERTEQVISNFYDTIRPVRDLNSAKKISQIYCQAIQAKKDLYVIVGSNHVYGITNYLKEANLGFNNFYWYYHDGRSQKIEF